MEIHTELAQKLRQYVRIDQPFGPPDASDIREPDCAAALFDWYNQAFAEMLTGSDVLVGRRGSGKSALLSTFKSKRFMQRDLRSDVGRDYRYRYKLPAKTLMALPDLVVDADTPQLVDDFELLCKRRGSIPPVEILARMWKVRVWRLVGKHLRDEHRGLWDDLPAEVRQFTDAEDILNREVSHGATRLVSSDLFVAEMDSFLRRVDKRCVVTFDNVDRYVFNDVQNAVLAGLVAATGKMIGAQPLSLDVKLCLPAESFEHFSKSIFRADKDLQRLQFLHWTTTELMHLAASRLKVYLQLHNTEEYDLVKDLRLNDRSVLRRFWGRYIPDKVRNAVGLEEDAITYLLRHTQLLPRHVLGTLNAIALRAVKEGRRPFETPFLANDVVAGVSAVEDHNARAVLAMYTPLYPKVSDLFDSVMPRLKRVFDYGYFQSVYASNGKPAMDAMTKPDFQQFWRLMLSTGAIGLLDSSGSTAIYATGVFEFNAKHTIRISDKDRLCVHPMFSRIYNVANDPPLQVVMARGSEFIDGVQDDE